MQDVQDIIARVCRLEAASRPYAPIPFESADQADTYLEQTRKLIIQSGEWNGTQDTHTLWFHTFGNAATPALVDFLDSLF